MDTLKRGDLATVALQDDQGKPRPALVVENDYFADLPAVSVLPITSTLVDAPLLRVDVEPSAQNGLPERSQVMADKPQTLHRSKVGGVIGHLESATLLTVNGALAYVDRDVPVLARMAAKRAAGYSVIGYTVADGSGLFARGP